MTDKVITNTPALGQAWQGNWRARVFDRLRSRGFENIAAFADSRPAASLLSLAEELSTDHEAGINHADVAAEQIARLWREEATSRDAAAVEHMARRVLVGELRRGLPEGWRSDWTENEEARTSASRAASATTSWSGAIGTEHEEAADRIFLAMLEEGRAGRIPKGWSPASADDPLLVDIFARYWSGANE